MVDYKPIVPQRLKYWREKHDVKQEDIATYLKIKQSSYANYEAGKRLPDINRIFQIADFYSTTVDKLLGRTDIEQ